MPHIVRIQRVQIERYTHGGGDLKHFPVFRKPRVDPFRLFPAPVVKHLTVLADEILKLPARVTAELHRFPLALGELLAEILHYASLAPAAHLRKPACWGKGRRIEQR